jgi:hypothetical protein
MAKTRVASVPDIPDIEDLFKSKESPTSTEALSMVLAYQNDPGCFNQPVAPVCTSKPANHRHVG